MRRKSDESKKPWALLVAEFFLILILVNYFTKICVLAMGMSTETAHHMLSRNLFIFFVEIFMFFVTADAMLGISSRRPKGWKKAVRGCMLLFLFTMIGYISIHFGVVSSTSTLATLNPLLVAPVVVAVYLLMLTSKVRNYYIPPMEEEKPLKSWIKFSLASELYHPGKYRVKYEE